VIKNLLSALGVVALVGIALYGVGWALLVSQTSSTNLIRPAAAAPASVETPADVLDAVIGAATQTASGVSANRLEAQRQRAADGIQRNFMILSALTSVLAAVWTISAWMGVKKVASVQRQRMASGAWFGGLLFATTVAGGLFWLTFAGRGPAVAVTAAMTGGMIIVGLLLAWLNYYLATAFSAPAVLRSSVPMANSIVPLDWSR
jgi:hypothetical protein